jgi:FecR-like protein
VTKHRLSILAWLALCLAPAGAAGLSAPPSPLQVTAVPLASDATSGATRLAQVQLAPPPQTPAAPAAAAQPGSDEPIGNVATLTGTATVTRNKQSSPLNPKDDIFLNDVLQTAANSTLGVTFNDATTFNLTANAQITVDSYVYAEGGNQNGALFDIAKGTVAFAAAAVAKTGDMKISTPTATLGIRGTTGLVDVPEGAAANNPNNVAIKLYPDADGRVGRIEVSDHAGVRLGSLTQGASGFTIRPGAGGRFAAQPLFISPQQALRDQGIVRQVHAAQTIGRQVVTEQRALRRANPQRQQQRQNAPQRQNELQRPGQNPPQQNRQGQQQPGVQPTGPGLQRPGLQNRPALQPRPPVAPRTRPPPKRKR